METERHIPRVGEWVEPDNWNFGASLNPGDPYVDSGFPGCQFRVELSRTNIDLAVNLKVTGNPHFTYYNKEAHYRSRVRIEFVGDCEPSEFTGGWLYHTL